MVTTADEEIQTRIAEYADVQTGSGFLLLSRLCLPFRNGGRDEEHQDTDAESGDRDEDRPDGRIRGFSGRIVQYPVPGDTQIPLEDVVGQEKTASSLC